MFFIFLLFLIEKEILWVTQVLFCNLILFGPNVSKIHTENTNLIFVTK